jgi:hypothetical protein
MTIGYIVLGVVLLAMGGVQIWLRHFAGGGGAEEADGRGRPRSGVRSGRVWESWTGILGFLGVIMGIVLVVLGVLGR